MNLSPPVCPRLCTVCQKFDVRALLLAAEAQGPDHYDRGTQKKIHAGLPRYFRQHRSLLVLKQSSSHCDLCSALWTFYSKIAQPEELTEESLRSSLGAEQIHLGTTSWDDALHSRPHLAVFQHGANGTTRTLAWFEVCANRGTCAPFRGRQNELHPEPG